MDVISTTARKKKERMIELLDMEEKLVEAREDLKKLKLKRVRARTGREKQDLLSLPKSLVLLETQIHNTAAELGAEEFLELTGHTDDRAKPLLALQVAKSKLYEARVGVIEARRRAERTSGSTSQARMNEVKSHKNKAFKTKYNSYHRRVKAYNDQFAPRPLLDDPSLADVERMEITDLFWSGGSTLSHTGEPWASDLPTREGIQLYLTLRSSQEELRRIAREVRQLTQWAVDYQSKIDSIDREAADGIHERQANTVSLHFGLSKDIRRLWFHWNADLISLIRSTSVYLTSPTRLAHDQVLVIKWKSLMEGQFGHWEQALARIDEEEEERDLIGEDEAEVEEDDLYTSENFEMEEEEFENVCII
ncbi:uncharacterized protein MELLADRAFT_95541 [Melampsora larici-populina 98AG31]|uniref:Uncharacterized protein n=1 Tax=Melampsora larici-populina (strain 98AG31 / pathotype 3-4-7) TaxID=747676 RepID=F4S9Q0_MELLP|nr:uncharacterized protein MELLADRAFT_95541 [Melampsora larici-populina 98AG31]EGF98630.1 hypothetical protein MELLADRAFT_95541 [Melampsora larici-populina 98AG31]